MELKEMNYLVVGAGKSGIAATKLLLHKGCSVILYDGKDDFEVDLFRQNNEELKDVEIIYGEMSDERLHSAAIEAVNCLVLSPGVPTDLDWILAMKNKGVKIWGEIELAYLCGKGDVIAITGTNGKTTTTTLVGEIMKAAFAHVDVVGNIGYPYTDIVEQQKEDSVTVAEISSFQLETVDTFHPIVSAILNITPDHLNRHHTMENYILAKENVAANQTKEEVCVLNYDSEDTKKFGEIAKASVVYFSSSQELKEGYFYKDGSIYRAGVRKAGTGYQSGEFVSYNDDASTPKKLMDIKDMNLVGICNVENVMASLAIAEAMNVKLEIALQVIYDFKAVEHRIEFVATKKGVDYYNDSKGTNPDAAIQGIKAMTKPTILIGGGYDKGSEYDDWIKAFDNKVKLLVLIGVTKDKIAACARKYGVENIVMAETFEECMDICIENAVPGDAVLLSPACASWGMFPNYEERGRIFKEIVRNIKE